MENRCENSENRLSLNDLSKIATGNGNNLQGANIAILHSLIHGILRKLNCENEVVQISGIKSVKLAELLRQSSNPMICVQDFEAPIDELKKLPKLEKRIESLEEQIEDHFQYIEIYKNMTKAYIQNYKHTYEKLKRLRQSAIRKSNAQTSKYKTLGDDDDHSTQPSLKKSNKFYINTTDTFRNSLAQHYTDHDNDDDDEDDDKDDDDDDTDYDDDYGYDHFRMLPNAKSRFMMATSNISSLSSSESELMGSARLSSGQQQSAKFKNKATINMSINQNRKQEQDALKIEMELQDGNRVRFKKNARAADKEKYFARIFCNENILSIPSSSNDLTRALLKSPSFFFMVKEYTLTPIENRVKSTMVRLEILEKNLQDRIQTSEGKTDISQVLESLVIDIENLKNTTTEKFKMELNCWGEVQGIFDNKLDKFDISMAKKQILNMFENLDASVERKLNSALKRPIASGVIIESDRKLKYSKEVYQKNRSLQKGLVEKFASLSKK